MKKFFIAFLAVMLLVVTGCGSKTKKLECEGEVSDQQVSYVVEFDKNDIMKAQTVKMIVPFEDDMTDEEKKSTESYMGLMCTVYNYDGIDCEVKSDKDKITLTMKYHFDKLTDEELANLGFPKTDLTYDEVKKNIESENGLTCK